MRTSSLKVHATLVETRGYLEKEIAGLHVEVG